MKMESFNNRRFRQIYNEGKHNANRLLVIYFTENNRNENRIGITVSKKLGNSVKRNLLKRRIKEAYRKTSSHLKEGYDIIFIARVSCADRDYTEIENAVRHLLKRNQLYGNKT